MYIGAMVRIIAPLILLSFSTVAVCQDDEAKCCCTTYDVSACLSRIHKQVDAGLNTTYQAALKTVTDSYTTQDVQNLKEAERTWIAYRDATCKAEYGLWGGGSGGPNARIICLMRLTRQRNAELENAYHSNH
jgi:uncharacterized protein YecT (DUF1311 family)